MNTDLTHIAKLSRPNISKVLLRKRLTALLEKGRKRPILWVSGPAGSGKTTLVAGHLHARKLPCLWYRIDEGDRDIAAFFYYLGLATKKAAPRSRKPLPLFSPEYLPGLSVFTCRFFEQLYQRLKPPFTLVFDNYQDVPLDSRFHEAMREGLSMLPDGVTVMVISRSEPPPAFARLRADGRMSFLGWNDVRFTFEESRKILALKAPGRLAKEDLARIHKKTEGWAAGLVLMAESLRTGGLNVRPLPGTQEEIFDYFANEILGKTATEQQVFLLKTAFLPTMTAAAAVRLTGVQDAERILSQMSRNNYFTEKHDLAEPRYRYHPLFREFLLDRAERLFSNMEILHLRTQAAGLLEQSGLEEDAAELFLKARDWDGLARIVESRSQAFIAQGRTQTVEGWLRSFPAEYRERAPWLAYWLGTCRISFSPSESLPLFEQAFKLFKAGNDARGTFLAWSGVIDSIFLGWGEFTQADPWISMLDELLDKHPRPFAPEIEARVTTSMVMALTLRQPYHRDIKAWVERAHNVAGSGNTNIRLKSFLNVYLGLYYLWVGDHAGADLAVNGIREAASAPDALPLAQVLGRLMEAVYQVRIGRHDLCRKAVRDGLEIAALTGVVIWNSQLYSQGAMNALAEGNSSEAAEYLGKMGADVRESRQVDACMYHHSMALHALLTRDLPRAFKHADAALRSALNAGSPFHEGIARVALAQVLHEQRKDRQSGSHLAQAHKIASGMESPILDFMILVCRVYFAFSRNDDRAAFGTLAKALALGREQGYVNFYWWRSDVMSLLCARALKEGIEPEYVNDLIRKRHLAPALPPSELENWPWPLKIYTLGIFELVRDGRPIRFSGKVQQKPLALLKALIALGGKDVAEERLTDLLWPDADGDLAHKSFEMTVIRLRKVLGHEGIVQLQERQLSLDERLCWVDVRALEEVLEKAEAAWKRSTHAREGRTEAVRLCDKAVEIYQGHFLPADAVHPWALSLREQLRSKIHRLIVKLGVHWEQAGQWEQAVEVFQKGIEADDLAEEFYLHLMVCYQHLGRKAEAVAVYDRCRAFLLSAVGIAPSSKMQALYATLKAH